jgi:aminoglycoside phosphotransferase family enzyme/predicted kinase
MSTLPTSRGRLADQAAEDRNDWPQSTAIAEWLKRPEAYKEPISRVGLKETHISWVFLTDRFVYKLKKPVRFDFLDFRYVEARHEACTAEVRLNQRLARGVYLGVVPICADAAGRLSLDGSGRVVDWIVKMRRLPADRMLDELIRNGRLSHEETMRLAGALASFYHGLSPVTMGASDYRQAIEQHARANREELLKPLHRLPASLVKRVHAAQLRFLQLEGGQFEDRVCDGRIVEGHGDLRPEHICLDGAPAIFDCIEFNEDFRRLDVADELGFLAMECDLLGADRIGAQIVDAYRSACHDQFSDELWNFYKCYRACVRAKVAVLRSASPSGDQAASGAAVDYLCLADRYAARLGPPMLIVIRGLMGVGKTTLAEALAERLGGELLQTDKLRKELFGPSAAPAEFNQDRYRPENRLRVYDELFLRAEQDLKEGLSVVLDGTFLTADLRRRAAGLARAAGALPCLVHGDCPVDVAVERIAERAADGETNSDATAELYELQRAQQEPDPPELRSVDIDTTLTVGLQLADVTERLRQLLKTSKRREQARRQ